MSLIEINPDLRRLTRAAERIASTLEQIALAAFGIHPAPGAATKGIALGPSSADDIGYASDENTLRQELEQLVMPETVRERDGSIVEEEVGDVLRQDRRS